MIFAVNLVVFLSLVPAAVRLQSLDRQTRQTDSWTNLLHKVLLLKMRSQILVTYQESELWVLRGWNRPIRFVLMTN